MRVLKSSTAMLVLLLAGAQLNSSLTPIAAQEQAATKWVPSSAFAMMDVHPKSMLAQPGMEIMPVELIKVFGEKEFGMALLELEQVVWLMDPIQDGAMQEPPETAAIFRFATPQTMGGRLTANLAKFQLEGKEGFELDEFTAVLVFDDKTFVVGTKKYLARMLGVTDASSPLIDMLNSARQSDQITGYLSLDPIRPMIMGNLPGEDEVPPPFRKFLELPNLIQSVAYRASFSEGGKEQIIINAVNPDAAGKIRSIVDEAIDLGKAAALNWVAAESGIVDPDYQSAIMKYAERVTNFIKTAVAPEVTGSQLVYTVEGNAGMGSMATTGVLIGMLLPAVQQVREAARRTTADNNLRQFALAALNYESTMRHLPAQGSYSEDGKPLLSWRVHILPLIEQNHLYEQFHLDEPWDSQHNIQLLDQMPAIYQSPNIPANNGKTVFLAVSGEGTVFDKGRKTRFGDISDGSSNTAMFVEADESEAVNWTQPTDWKFDPSDPFRGLGNLRPGGFNTAFADGSTGFVSRQVDPEVWKAVCTMAGGEVVDSQSLFGNRR